MTKSIIGQTDGGIPRVEKHILIFLTKCKMFSLLHGGGERSEPESTFIQLDCLSADT